MGTTVKNPCRSQNEVLTALKTCHQGGRLDKIKTGLLVGDRLS